MITPPNEATATPVNSVSDQPSPESIAWTYERRLALYILGAMSVGYPGLHDTALQDDALTDMIDTVADALIDGMHTLGCPDYLSLSQILDYASSFENRRKHGGAE